jgi:SET and MYND domain-containing protein
MQFMKEPSNEVKLGAMYHLGSFCNHSCYPNVGLRAPSTSAEITWIAFKDIKAGEEVLASYVNSDLEYPIRHELLKRHYKFDCDCPKCKNQL